MTDTITTDWLTVEEAMTYTGIKARSTLWRHIQVGNLHPRKSAVDGRRLLFSREELDRLADVHLPVSAE